MPASHPRLRSPQPGGWLVIAAAVMWGTTGTAQALAPASAQPAAVGTARLAIGGLALFLIALGSGALRDLRRWPAGPTLLAAASMAAYQLCFFAGVARAGVAVGTIVGIGSSPVMAGALGWLVRGERPGLRWAGATLLAILGSGLLVGAGDRLDVDPLGVLLALGAGASYALFTLASKSLLESRPPQAVMAATFGLGAVLLSPLLFLVDLSWMVQPGGLLVALHLGLVTVALAYSLFARGLRATSVATAASLTLAEPLTAGTLGILVLGEQLTPLTALGIGLVLGGLLLLTVME